MRVENSTKPTTPGRSAGMRARLAILLSLATAAGFDPEGPRYVPCTWPGFGKPRGLLKLHEDARKRTRYTPHQGGREKERRRLGGFRWRRRTLGWFDFEEDAA